MPHVSREARKEYLKKWHEKTRDRRLRQASDRYRNYSQEQKIFKSAQSRAKKIGLEFSIDLEDIVIPDICPILKEPLVVHTRYAPSLDRRDTTKGYIKGNVWVISRKANVMKNDASLEDLRKFAEWVRNLSTL